MKSTLTAPKADEPDWRSRLGWPALGIVVLLAVWQVLSFVVGDSSAGVRFIPSLQNIATSFDKFAGYWPGGWGAGDVRGGAEETVWGAVLGAAYNTAWTLTRLFVGLVAGCFVGIGLGIVLSWSRVLRGVVAPVGHFLRMMPLLAMLPLFGLWFGISELGTYVFVGFAISVLLFVTSLSAIASVPDYYRNYAASLGASKLTIYRSVVLPMALTELRSGLLLAIPFAWSAVLAAEFIGKQYGLGRVLHYALLYGATDLVAATGIIVIALGSLSYVGVRAYLDHLTRWA